MPTELETKIETFLKELDGLQTGENLKFLNLVYEVCKKYQKHYDPDFKFKLEIYCPLCKKRHEGDWKMLKSISDVPRKLGVPRFWCDYGVPEEKRRTDD